MYAVLHAQFPSIVKVARKMIEARNPPIPQHIDTHAVKYPLISALPLYNGDKSHTRMLGGTISAAYAVVRVWKIPQGIPQTLPSALDRLLGLSERTYIFPTRSIGRLTANTKMKTIVSLFLSHASGGGLTSQSHNNHSNHISLP